MKKSYFSGVDKLLKPLLKKGVEEGVFSGAAIGVYKYSGKVGEKLIICYGKTKNDSSANPVTEKSWFDLASLTKPLCTVPAILSLIEAGKITMDTQIKAVIGTKTPLPFKKIKITHLLSHSSGLKAYKPFYLDFKDMQDRENKQRILKSLFQEEIDRNVGETCEYSDLGYILLGEIVERISGEKLNDYFTSRIANPLGLENQIMFRLVDKFTKTDNQQVVATQFCPWRKRLLQGEVDDEHSWLMNGVAGHAGLFGTIQGVLDITSHLLNQWQGREDHPSYSNVLLQKALIRQYRDQTWCLGFDTPSQPGSSAGKYISKESVGHLGFTGTSFWIDPVKDMVIVLLTNRIHPTRKNEKIKEFRPLVHNTIFQALGTL